LRKPIEGKKVTGDGEAAYEETVNTQIDGIVEENSEDEDIALDDLEQENIDFEDSDFSDGGKTRGVKRKPAKKGKGKHERAHRTEVAEA
jgi:hypothetical protein